MVNIKAASFSYQLILVIKTQGNQISPKIGTVIGFGVLFVLIILAFGVVKVTLKIFNFFTK